jgi:hypothetical protein
MERDVKTAAAGACTGFSLTGGCGVHSYNNSTASFVRGGFRYFIRLLLLREVR